MTEDATYVTFVGTLYQGRRDIVESHRTLFAKFLEGTKLADEIQGIRLPGPDLAVVNSRGDTYKGDKRPSRLTKTQTTVLVREGDGQWRISAFHNTKGKPLMEAVSFKPPRAPSPLSSGTAARDPPVRALATLEYARDRGDSDDSDDSDDQVRFRVKIAG